MPQTEAKFISMHVSHTNSPWWLESRSISWYYYLDCLDSIDVSGVE